jgi:hypothetical protein
MPPRDYRCCFRDRRQAGRDRFSSTVDSALSDAATTRVEVRAGHRFVADAVAELTLLLSALIAVKEECLSGVSPGDMTLLASGRVERFTSLYEATDGAIYAYASRRSRRGR